MELEVSTVKSEPTVMPKPATEISSQALPDAWQLFGSYTLVMDVFLALLS
jgi:hypothetical protein